MVANAGASGHVVERTRTFRRLTDAFHVVAELVGAELDLLAGKQRDDLVDEVAACGRRVDRDQRNDDQGADDRACDSEASKDATPPRRAVGRFG